MKTAKFKILNNIGMAALMSVLTLMWGCSSEGEDGSDGNGGNGGTTVSGIKFATASGLSDWQVDWQWNEEMPDWQAPISTLYEERMYITLKLDEKFVPYSTSDDRVAVFIGDECRGVSERNVMPSDPNSIYFTIPVAGSKKNSEELASLLVKYYCGGMKQIFKYPGFARFTPDGIIGDTWDQSFPFGSGGSKYTDFKKIDVRLTGDIPFTPKDDDIVGVFIDGECRGTGTTSAMFDLWLTSAAEEGKEFQVRYYSADKQGIYTLEKPILIDKKNLINITFNF